MTLQIPDDLARGLEGITAAQNKSIEQLAVECLRSLVETRDSPQAILHAVRKLPHPSSSAVDDLEAAIASVGCPEYERGAFDGRIQG